MITPDTEVPIAIFSLSEEAESVSHISIDEGYEKYIVVFKKVEATK